MFCRISVLTICALILILSSCAKSNDGIVPKASEDDNSLLWVISGNGLLNNSYLLGTVHSFGPSKMDSITSFKSILPEIECVVSEADILSEVDIPKMKIKKWKQLLLPKGVKFQDYYSLDEYYLIDEYIYDIGLGSMPFYKFYPAVILLLSQAQEISNRQQTEGCSSEYYLQKYAVEMNKKLLFLDSIHYQTELMASLYLSHALECSIEKQAEDLLAFVRSMKTTGEFPSSDDMLDHISEAASEDYSFEVENQYFQLSQRNKKWMAKIPRIINHHSTLIAVGAAHLFGNEGLIDLLREEGYDVRQYEP